MDTICAISTAYGTGGIAVVRVSGPEAMAMVEHITGAVCNDEHFPCVHYRRIADLDDVVITAYRAPHSFTGEDVVEISCHGSLYVQQELVRRLIDAGCRQAKGGEFTQRAFLNGKMDLTEAEAVADLIAAQTKAEKDLALCQLRGGISLRLDELRDRLLKLTSLIELELDFADHEELEFADRQELHALSQDIYNELHHLTESFKTGNAIKNGIPVAIVGRTNAGKSTLLNALVGEERAIVSEVAGTTRDTIEDSLVIDGVLFRLIDTAGLRETTDEIETLGIARSKQAMEKAQLVLHVIDATLPEPPLCIEGKTVIHVYNKIDLSPTPIHPETKDGNPVCLISAKQGELADLRKKMVEVCSLQPADEVMLTNMRHYEALMRAQQAISRVEQGLSDHLSGEMLSLDLQDCLNAMGEVTGKISNQEVLNNIFSKFCIGK